MDTWRMATLDGGTVEIGAEQAADLAAHMRGPLLVPGDGGYEQARAVWNGMIDRRPAVIARCVGAADVVSAVNWARQHNVVVSVRGGGHNVAGNGVYDQALMIDLSQMRSVRVDPGRGTVRVEPGCRWADVDAETQAFGLATTGGTVSETGVAGLTLGGGLGHLAGIHGLTCDNLRSVDLVTASGDYVRASADENPDLFWAMRGAGANFGVATSFEFDVHPVGPMIFGGMALFAPDRFGEVLHLFRELCQSAPDELALVCGFISDPDGNPLVGLPLAYFGDLGDGERYTTEIRALGPLVADFGPIPYRAMQAIFDPAAPAGLRRYWKSGMISELDDSAISTIVTHSVQRPSPLTAVLLFHLHGGMTRYAPDHTAFSARRNGWDVEIVPQWTAPDQDQSCIGWARAFWAEMQPHAVGVYVNHLERDDGPDRVRSSYGPNWDRLVELKQKYDPDNFFRGNNNIPPH